MVLKELEIQGFKSFPDRVKISFGSGITGVVGPNGSGKSNISDAIRWVLGETSSRQLRGSGKMEDVIFGGTRLRGAMGYAMVRLTLDNRDRTLDLDADEVVVGRKYYRSGDSEYTINGQSCRLRDVYELFLDTGLGRSGYSIIGQGRIAEIVAARSEERREIFEEASGIAKYRFRKNEAERRLASAEENLERLRDILGELESRVGPLEKESEKAKRFLELAAERKSCEVTLWTEEIHRAREAMRQQQHSYETAEADYLRLDGEEKAAQAEAEEIRMQAQQLTVAIERLNGDIRSITEEMSGSESRLAVLENDIVRNEERAAVLREEIQTGDAGQSEFQKQVEAHRAEIEALTQRAQQLTVGIAELEAQLARLQQENAASGARRGAVSEMIGEMTGRQTDCRVAAAAARSAAESAGQRREFARTAAEQERTQLAEQKRDREDTASYLAQLIENEKRLANIVSGLEMKKTARRRALEDADAAEQKITRELDAAQQRLSVLRDLEKNMDGYQKSVKSVMRAASARRLRGVIGPISSILTVEPGCEVAIETALGAALQNIVVESESSAKAAIAYLREQRDGRATFLPLDTVQPGVFRGQLPPSARLASSLVRVDERYSGIISNLLGRIVVVEEINEAGRVAKSLGYRNRVVTMDGQVVNAGGSFTGGSVQHSAGLFTRKQEMETLKATIARLQKESDSAQEATDRCKAELDRVSAELTAAGSERITANSDRIRAEMEQKRLDTVIQRMEESLAQSETLLSALALQIEESNQAAEQAEAEDARLNEQIAALSQELSQLTEGDDSFLASRSRLADTLSAQKLEQLSIQKDCQLHRNEIESLNQRARETGDRRTLLEQQLAQLAELNAKSRESIARIESDRSAAKERIAEKERAIAASAQQRLERQRQETEANAAARQAAEQRESVSQEMARLSERRKAAETEYEQTVAKLWDEYQLSLSDAEALRVEFATLTALRAQTAELRAKIRALGSVNVAAIEEYQEVKARYDSLSTQVNDVEKSRTALLKLIGELSDRMREIFADSFRVINDNFGRIFRELFGGGEAGLTLENEQDVLSSGIQIHVAPPGKVIKNLSALSGGEQALVAISIYFAILSVNPSPFCILDEIEAALDDANVVRYAQYLQRISDKTQFIVITHRRGTMEAADTLYGVTMQENGISKLLRLDLEQVDAALIS